MTSPPTPNSGNPPSDEMLRSQLANAVAMSAKEDQIAWTVFGIFWAANVLLVGALFVTGKTPERLVGIIIAATGTVLSLIWALMQSRALRFLAFYEEVQRSLERRLLGDESKFALSPKLNKKAFDDAPGTGARARLIMIWSSIGTAIAWFIGAVCFAVICRT
jgi:hypothetical protein